MIKEIFKKNNVLIAHRGYSSKYPENTKIAFENVNYTNIIELDIVFTKDFEFVIFHDDTLNRTTNFKDIFPHGKSSFLRDFSYEELLELDLSSWFDKDIKTQKIMKLEELILYAKAKKIYLNIEIKKMKSIKSKLVAQKLYELLEKHKFLPSCVISSFKHSYLKELKKIDTSILIAPLFSKKQTKNIEKYLINLKADFYNIDKTLVNKALIYKLKRVGILTSVYTVNSKITAKNMFDKGVCAIFSDRNIL